MAYAWDIHTHPPTEGYIVGAHGPYLDELRRHWRDPIEPRPIEAMVEEYRSLDLRAVISAWDAETTTGLPATTNDEIARIVERFPEMFVGWAHVDPWKGKLAVRELRRAIKVLGLRGVGEFHPIMQAFKPTDSRFDELWGTCVEFNIPVSFHTGTTGSGAGMAGGAGFQIYNSHPIYIDELAARFPALTIVACHPSVPWQDDMLAVAVHKKNVVIDLSGWSPRLFSPNLIEHINGTLADKVMFGTDYPWLRPQRWLNAFSKLPIRDDVREKVLRSNAERLLGLR
jgi:predicted TIM-barrel fold metal-dependent hydrolase